MKRTVLFSALALIFSCASLFAGSIDYLTNQSADICITFHRTASTDESADIVNYNPAGTAFLPKGLYLDLSSQTLFKPYSEKGEDPSGEPGSFEQDQPTPYLPNFYAVYSLGKIDSMSHAVYLQAGIVAGGGTLDWKDGTIGTYAKYTDAFDDHGGVAAHSFTAYSVYYGIGAGVAYSFLDGLFSVSAGVRMVMPERFVELSAESVNIMGGHILGDHISLKGKFLYSATGFTPILGACLKPLKGLTIGMRYECETALQFEYKRDYLYVDPESVLLGAISVRDTVEEGLAASGLYDGNKFNINLPHIISTGAEYDLSDFVKGLTVMGSATFYLVQCADLGPYYDTSGEPAGNISEFFNMGWEAGIGAVYQIWPELKAGGGLMFTTSGAKKSYFESQYTITNCSANPPLDSITLGTGATYIFQNLGLDVTLGLTWTHYLPVNATVIWDGENVNTTYNVKYAKDVVNIALGVGYRM